jgi:hypothetical protein
MEKVIFSGRTLIFDRAIPAILAHLIGKDDELRWTIVTR